MREAMEARERNVVVRDKGPRDQEERQVSVLTTPLT